MMLKNGKRCLNPAKDGRLCGRHRQSLTSREKTIQKLILAGSAALALNNLINLVEKLVHLYPKIEPGIEPLFRGWPFRMSMPGRERVYLQDRLKGRADVQYLLKLLTEMESRKDYNRVERYAIRLFMEMHREFDL
jgi:hypothetical protein